MPKGNKKNVPPMKKAEAKAKALALSNRKKQRETENALNTDSGESARRLRKRNTDEHADRLSKLHYVNHLSPVQKTTRVVDGELLHDRLIRAIHESREVDADKNPRVAPSDLTQISLSYSSPCAEIVVLASSQPGGCSDDLLTAMCLATSTKKREYDDFCRLMTHGPMLTEPELIGMLKILITPQNMIVEGFDTVLRAIAKHWGLHGFKGRFPIATAAMFDIFDGAIEREWTTLKKGGTLLNTFLIIYRAECSVIMDTQDLDDLIADAPHKFINTVPQAARLCSLTITGGALFDFVVNSNVCVAFDRDLKAALGRLLRPGAVSGPQCDAIKVVCCWM